MKFLMSISTIALLTCSNISFAAVDLSDSVSTTSIQPIQELSNKSNGHAQFVGVELSLALLNGAGATYHVALGDHFSIGPNVRYYEQEDLFEFIGKEQYKYTEFGLQTKYRFNGTGRSGVYAGLNYLNQTIKGEVKATLFYETKGKSKSYNRHNAELQVGYIFLLGRPRNAQFFIDVSGAYGREVVDGYVLTSNANDTKLTLNFERTANVYGLFGFAF